MVKQLFMFARTTIRFWVFGYLKCSDNWHPLLQVSERKDIQSHVSKLLQELRQKDCYCEPLL